MAKKIWNEPINKYTNWGGDDSTTNLPVSGEKVQEFIKDSLEQKMGTFYYDPSNNRYIVFSDIINRDLYLEDPTKTELILGTFDAPFNYNAEINLNTSAYNAVFLGSTGNYINFTFDVKNKQGSSTGENVIITYTFIRNAVKKTFTQIGKYGETINFNIDEYLEEGTNNIIVAISGQTTLASTTVNIIYNVINLNLSAELDISKIYNLSDNTVKELSIPFTVSGYGTKIVEWYLDGELLDFEKEVDEIVTVEESRFKHITLSYLTQGRHNLQIRAYTTVNGESFYTDTIYKNLLVFTNSNNDTIIGVSAILPKEEGIVTGENFELHNLIQYVPYTLEFATYSPSNIKDLPIHIYIDDIKESTIISNNEVINKYIYTPIEFGQKIFKITDGTTEYTFPINIEKTSMDVEEIKSGLVFDFNAKKKNNNSADRNIWEDETNKYFGTLTGFDWNNNSGWVNNRLKMNKGTSFSINYAPLEKNTTSTGRTIELEFKTTKVTNDDTVICDLTNSSGTGLKIAATKAILMSKGKVKTEINFKSNEDVRLSFVIERSRTGLTLIYSNGCIARASSWASSDNYDSNKTLKFEATEGAGIELKSIRVYENVLNADQILNNYILYRDTIEEMREVYDRNDVYYPGTKTFSPDKMVSRLPVMIITGDIPALENTTDKNKQIIVDIEYNNIQDPSRSFKMVNAALRPQGTSSMAYPKKNFRIYTKKIDSTILYDASGKIVKDKLYSFKDKAQPVSCWCLKADYAESSGTHNTGIAKLWNEAFKNAQVDGEYKLRTKAQQLAIDNEYPYDVRTTIDGFPILLFYRPSKDDDVIFIGKYNFNNDKSTESVFGFVDIPDFDNSKMQCWELLNNGHPLGLFNTIENFDRDWTEAFEARYPDDGDDAYTGDLKAFCTWISSVSSSDFATQKWDHLDIYKIAGYWIYLMRHAGADQFVKNSMFTSEDGQHFYFILYDNDTINGLINTGEIGVKPEDDRNSVDSAGAYIFAGHNSKLWNFLEQDTEFQEIVLKVDKALSTVGINYSSVINMFDKEQSDKWVERVYNQDSQYKYIGPYTNQGINNLFMLQGKRDLHRRWFLAKRFNLYDSKFVSGDYKSSTIEIKYQNETPTGVQIKVTAGSDLYYGYGVNSVSREIGIKLNTDECYTFTTKEVLNVGDVVRIYGGSNIKELDLSTHSEYLNKITLDDIVNQELGTKLTTLKLGNASKTNTVEGLVISGLNSAENLEYLDIQGLTAIKNISLEKHPYFKTLKAFKSSLTSVKFTDGAPVELLELPTTMQSLVLENLPILSSSKINIGEDNNFSKVKSFTIKGCPNISNDFNWVNDHVSSPDLFIMDNIDWTVDEASAFHYFLVRNLNYGQQDNISLKGVVFIPEIEEDYISIFYEIFGESIFNKKSDFYIDTRSKHVSVQGASSILEGSSTKYTLLSTGYNISEIEYNAISFSDLNAESYVHLDSDTGYITIDEGIPSNFTFYIKVNYKRDKGIGSITKQVTVNKRVYPESDTTSLELKDIDSTKAVYILSMPNNVNGEYYYDIILDDSYSNKINIIDNNNNIVVSGLESVETILEIPISIKFYKRYNNENYFTLDTNVLIIGEEIAEVDSGICTALYAAGFTSSEKYVTKTEASRITADNLNTGTTSSTSIFYNYRTKIKTFRGFQYFTAVTSLKPYTIYVWSNLTDITLPKSCVEIDKYNVYGTSLSGTIEITGNITTIKNTSFTNNKAVNKIILNLPKLTDYENSLDNYVQSIDFGKCTSLVRLTNCFNSASNLTNVILPPNLELIDNCFNSTKTLNTITFPETLKTISNNNFKAATALNIEIAPNNSYFVSDSQGIVYNSNQSRVVLYRNNSSFVTIPITVSEISDYAFYERVALKSIEGTNNVGDFGSYSFYNSGLTNIVWSSTITNIGDYAFYYTELTELNLKAIVRIGKDAFSCSKLKSISLESVGVIDEYCFSDCTALEKVIFGGIENMSDSCFVGQSAFSKCTSLKSVIITGNISTSNETIGIGATCFTQCLLLETIEIRQSSLPSISTNLPFGFGTTQAGISATGEKKLIVPSGYSNYTDTAWEKQLCNPDYGNFVLTATL